MTKLSVLIAYYDNKEMLEYQLSMFKAYPKEVRDQVEFVIVDDASPTIPAEAVIRKTPLDGVNIKLFRILKDIPWGQEMARNLGVVGALSEWVFFLDIDHTIPTESIRKILQMQFVKGEYYYFGRDAVSSLSPLVTSPRNPSHCLFIINSEDYWDVGGYDEGFSGHYGYSDAYFQHRAKGKLSLVFREDIRLHVFQYTVIPNAQHVDMSRSKKYNKIIYDAKINGLSHLDTNYLKRPWQMVELRHGGESI